MSSGQELLSPPATLQGRPTPVDLCRRTLSDEGFRVEARPRTGGGGVELIAVRGQRILRALVVLEREVDARQTATRIRNANRRGETRVFVPWRMKWRMASNLERWGIPGVALSEY